MYTWQICIKRCRWVCHTGLPKIKEHIVGCQRSCSLITAVSCCNSSPTPTRSAHWLQKGTLSASLPHKPPIIVQSSFFLRFLLFGNLSSSCSSSAHKWRFLASCLLVAVKSVNTKVYLQLNVLCPTTNWPAQSPLWLTREAPVALACSIYFLPIFSPISFVLLSKPLFCLYLFGHFLYLLAFLKTCYPVFSHHYKLHFVK